MHKDLFPHTKKTNKPTHTLIHTHTRIKKTEKKIKHTHKSLKKGTTIYKIKTFFVENNHPICI